MTLDFTSHIQNQKYFSVISELAVERNEKIYIVGGYVRDLILDRKRDEIDFLIIGNGPEFARNLAKKLNVEKVNIFKNYGTAHFHYNNFDFEFVGARKESYQKSSRNPEIEVGTFHDDINRRDFTINTLAISLNNENYGEIIDTFNGYQDIVDKTIRTPLNPFDTFNDDPLRIMRAFRFASQLNFNVDLKIIEAAEKLAQRLNIVSQERITDEFFKILKSEKPSIGLKLLQQSKVMHVIFPEIANLAGVEQKKEYHHKDVFLHTCEVVDNISKVTDNVWLRFGALVHDIAKPQTKKFIDGIGWSFHGHEELGARMMKKIFAKLKLPNSNLQYVEKLIRLHLRPIALVSETVTDSAIRRLSANAGEDLDDLISLCRADITSKNPDKVTRYLKNYEIVMQKVKEVQEKDNLRAFQSPVKGEEIMKICNLKPSKQVGIIKHAIEEAILDGKIANTYEEALKYLYEIKNKISN
ncbi:MAG: HD domain-containing protein [Ignavibacteriales bacterium]|nr:HD domain-containing protein [Ignavibacteriales bacterium]MCB9209669.1 HD domain-containing protein [Ignavibacteriales bacterium]